MPQMSPMPWVLILIFTLSILLTITSYMYFYNNNFLKLNTMKFNNFPSIKIWW
uniref:ATP synthase F0 subunit 8 n=1 Tax=Livia junci TaxID=1449964 RepID=A0A344A2I6_9HEMI|nr:ATP synthase F0 subunit 8 [Livia junci]AWU48977.1 ATP synthase F0 subunit 8 [Livia junci]